MGGTSIGPDLAPGMSLPARFRNSIRARPEERLNVGFVSYWFERGQAYVTKALREAIATEHETFVLARTGMMPTGPQLSTIGEWAIENLTTHDAYEIPHDLLVRWIQENHLHLVVFNEEYDFGLVESARISGVRTIGVYYWELFDPQWFQLVRKLYTTVIAPTRCTHQRFRQLGIDNVVHLKWCVDETNFRVAQERNSQERVRFFHPAGWGGMHQRRATNAVIQAFRSANLSQAELLVHTQHGDGSERADGVEIRRGTVSRDELIEMYQSSDVTVLPSKWEGLGLTFLESIGCGLPILTIDAPPMNEFVRNGRTGFSCRVAEGAQYPGIFVRGFHVDIRDLAEKMALLMDAQLRTQMHRNTLELRTEFSQKRFQKQVLDLVQDVTVRRDGGPMLNLGCGTDIRFDYVNVDQRQLEGVDQVSDISRLPFADGSVSEVLANDILEHFPRAATKAILAEWIRVLRPDGVLKIQCPDLRALSEVLLSNTWSIGDVARRIYGGQTYDGNYHYAGFDIPEMKRLLRSFGSWPLEATRYNANFSVQARRTSPVDPRQLNISLLTDRAEGISSATGSPVEKALGKLGHRVETIDSSLEKDRIDELLERPVDLLIVGEPSVVDPKVLELLPWPLVLWCFEEFLANPQAANQLRRVGYAFDHVFHPDPVGVERLRGFGISCSALLHSCTDPEIYSMNPKAAKKHDILIIGRPHPNREALIDRLRGRFDVIVAASQNVHDRIDTARIVLCPSFPGTGYPTQLFDALASRAFVLSNPMQGEQLFQDRKHLVHFDENNIEEVLGYYLAHETEREAIARAGQQEVIARHTYVHRVLQILSEAGLSDEPAPSAVGMTQVSLPGEGAA